MGCGGSTEPASTPSATPSAPPPQQPVAASSEGKGHGGAVKGKGKGKGKGRGLDINKLKHGKFQVMLGGDFKDYGPEEDGLLKRAYLVGQPNAKFHLRGQDYEYSFQNMTQMNLHSGKSRKIRPPYGMTAPQRPVLPAGPMTFVRVPQNPSESMEIDDPNNPGRKITVMLPPGARPGSQLAVPVPEKGETVQQAAERQSKWSTGSKVAVAGAVLGGLAVGGVILGEHLSGGAISAAAASAAEGSPELAAAGDWIGTAAGDVGDALGGVAGDAGAWMGGAAEDVGDWAADAADHVGDWTAGAADDVADWIGDAGTDVGAFVMNLF